MGREFKFLLILSIFILLSSGVIFRSSPEKFAYSFTPSYLEEIARRWAPTLCQAATGHHDFITRFDFDGDWIGHNNWEHYEGCISNLYAYVYYSIVESNNYYFLTYSFFHPKDVGNPLFGDAHSHENDFEGCRMVIKKDGTPYGSLYFLETIAHKCKYVYDPSEIGRDSQGRPIIYIKDRKHSVYGTNHAKVPIDCWNSPEDPCRIFPTKDGGGVIYRYSGRGAEKPVTYNAYDPRALDVSYELS